MRKEAAKGYELPDPCESGAILAETIRGVLESNFHPHTVRLLAYNLGYWDALHTPERKLEINYEDQAIQEEYEGARNAFKNGLKLPRY